MINSIISHSSKKEPFMLLKPHKTAPLQKHFLFTLSHLLYKVISIGGSSNGRTAAFEAVNLGPIPSPPAMHRNVHVF